MTNRYLALVSSGLGISGNALSRIVCVLSSFTFLSERIVRVDAFLSFLSSGSTSNSTAAGFGAQNGPAGWVDDHNFLRCLHGAQKVTWDNDLAQKAQAWADNLASQDGDLTHSDCYNNWPPSGENLAMGYGTCAFAGEEFAPGATIPDGAPYDQHCATAAWYNEYKLWAGEGDWRQIPGVGHFTAMVWKGIDLIGCAGNGKYFACEYGSTFCKAQGEQFGGSACSSPTPAHLANFNQESCGEGVCVAVRTTCDDTPSAAAASLLGNGTLPGPGDLGVVGNLLWDFKHYWFMGLMTVLGCLGCFACTKKRTGRVRGLVGAEDSDGDELSTRREHYNEALSTGTDSDE